MAEKETLPAKVEVPIAFVTDITVASKLINAEKLKTGIAGFSELCESIVVVDESSEKKATEMLTALNQVLNKLEEKRKLIKAPYTAAGKFIDAVAADIKGKADTVILNGKNKLVVYRDGLRKEAAEAQKKSSEALEQKQVEGEIKSDKLALQVHNIYVKEHEGIVRCNATKTMDDLKAWHADYTAGTTSCLQPVIAPDIPHRVADALERLRMLKEERKQVFQGLKTAEQWKGVYEAAVAACKNFSNKMIQEVVEQVKEESTEIGIVAQAAIIESKELDKGKRFKWKYDLESFANVPEEWKQVNPDMVKAFIESNKTTLANGQIVNGIRFTREEVVVLR